MCTKEVTMRMAKGYVGRGFWSGSALLVLLNAACGQDATPDMVEARTSALISATWTQQGPAPLLNGQENVLPFSARNPAAGAVESVVPQPGNANIIYVATVNGGVWKTTNAL